MARRATSLKIDLARRAEIGAEKRRRTRAAILIAAFRLIGQERGRFQRIEDFCNAADISRGTFYNYFTGIEELYETLSYELSHDFEIAVAEFMGRLGKVSARTAAAVRYHLRAAMENPRWGWAMVHTSLGQEVFGPAAAKNVKRTIQEGIDSGEFTISDSELGKTLLLGTSLGATLDILYGRADEDYAEEMARSILLALGVKKAVADAVVQRPLPILKPIDEAGDISPVNFWAEMD